MALHKVDNSILDLIATPITLTTSYQDLYNTVPGGPYIKPMDCTGIALWIKLAINTSSSVRIKMVCKKDEAASDLYLTTIRDVAPTYVSINPHEVLLGTNADQNVVITFPLADQIPFVKFMVKADTIGVTPAQILSAGISFTSSFLGGA